MKIAGYQIEVSEESLDIYLSGCDGACKGCHNPELWDFSVGKDFRLVLKDIIKSIRLADEIASKGGLSIRYIRILGGEPLLQSTGSLMDLLNELEQNTTKELILYTRYDLWEFPKFLQRRFSYIKTGAYDSSVTEYKEEYGFKVLKNQKFNKRGVDY